jgi:hypothetical protein
LILSRTSEQFQKKRVTVFRQELRQNKGLEHFRISIKNGRSGDRRGATKGLLTGFVYKSV